MSAERPPLKHTVRWADGDKTIHMSYGLWNDLQRVCPEPSIVVEGGLTDPYLRDYLIRRCFTESKKSIIDEKDLIPEDEMPCGDPHELEGLLAWIEGHLLYFFRRFVDVPEEAGGDVQKDAGRNPCRPLEEWLKTLSLTQSLCWAFDCCERDLEDELNWRYSIYEMVDKVQLKLGFETSTILCQHSSMADIVSMAFGGGTATTTPGKLPEGVNDLAAAGSYDQAVANINAAFKWG